MAFTAHFPRHCPLNLSIANPVMPLLRLSGLHSLPLMLTVTSEASATTAGTTRRPAERTAAAVEATGF